MSHKKGETTVVQQYLPTLHKAILAGMMIALGATAYLIIENHYIGAALFTIGLYTIYTLDFYLFTGKVGYFLEDKDWRKLIFIWIGNLIGAVATGYAMLCTRLVDLTELRHHAAEYAHIKLNDNLLSCFILGIFCGLMMFIAAECFKKTQNTHNSLGGYIGLFLCVMLFLLLGFEHSIANMYYFTIAQAWSAWALVPLLVVTMGNAVGGLLIKLVLRPAKYKAHTYHH